MKTLFLRRKSFWIVFGVPNILCILYFGVLASPRYVSQSSLVVYQANQTDQARPVSVQLSGNGGGVSLEGDYLVARFIRSWQCFKQQDPARLRAHWSRGDIVSRFGGLLDLFDTTPTGLWRYYRNNVTTSIDKDSSIMTVRVVGYNRHFAEALNHSVLAAAAKAVNQMNGDAFRNAETFFDSQVRSARKTLKSSILALSDIQRKSKVIDPSADYQSKLTLLNTLINKRITMQAQMRVFAKATPGSARVRNLRVELQAVDKEIAATTRQIEGGSTPLSSVVGPFAYHQALIRNAESRLKADEEQLLAAQQTALQHQYFMEYVDHPAAPPNPVLPYRLWWILVTMAATFTLYLIVKPANDARPEKTRQSGSGPRAVPDAKPRAVA